MLPPLVGTPHDISVKGNFLIQYAENTKNINLCVKKIIAINFYLLVQVGGESKDREPFDRHSVVMLSLVSYPVKQL